jgi:antirestriction protein ArdC
VKKGAKSRIVVFFKPLVKKTTTTDEETGEDIVIEKKHYMLQYYRVFHLNDCEGIKSKFTDDEQTETTPVETILNGEKVIEDYISRESANGFSLGHRKGDRAYYSPVLDEVILPLKEQFKEIAEYYSTAFHEIAHSTMKECRCNRKETERAFFGGESYSKEELVAEITSANICSVTGIETASSFRNSTAYIQSWLKALKNDPKMIVFASAQAERATKYILGIA